MFLKRKNMELARLFLEVKNHFIQIDSGIMSNINFLAQLLEVKDYFGFLQDLIKRFLGAKLVDH